jgi:hypothetical protein
MQILESGIEIKMPEFKELLNLKLKVAKSATIWQRIKFRGSHN